MQTGAILNDPEPLLGLPSMSSLFHIIMLGTVTTNKVCGSISYSYMYFFAVFNITCQNNYIHKSW